jgi:hypothetical protein
MLLAAALCGCQPLPQDASRTYPPGRASDVAQGPSQGDADGRAGFSTPRVMAWRDFPRGSMPVIEPPEVIHIWFFPAISGDGAAFREGFWCHRVTRTFAWGAARAMREESVPLIPERDTTGDAPVGPVEPQAGFIDSLQDLGHEAAPYAAVRTLPQAGEPAATAPASTVTAPAAASPGRAGTPAARASEGR